MSRSESTGERRRYLHRAVLMSGFAHACVWLLANRSHEPLQRAASMRSEVDFSFVRPIFQPPTVLPPPPAASMATESTPSQRTKSSRPPVRVSKVEPAPAPAPSIATASAPEALGDAPPEVESSSTPVDFTHVGLVVETTSASNVTAATPGSDEPASPQASPGAGEGRSSGVVLEQPNWSCPWPRDADAALIHEQTVVIRVVVAATGVVESAAVVVDAGHGFGAAAVECALRTRFTPARDAAGNPTRAQSPPIRVRFTR